MKLLMRKIVAFGEILDEIRTYPGLLLLFRVLGVFDLRGRLHSRGVLGSCSREERK